LGGVVVGKVKDLTGRGRGKVRLDKEVVLPNGSIKVVPYKQWEFVVIRNPTGATAQRAKANKDPDLEKIRVGTIPVGVFLDAPVVDVPMKRVRPIRTPLKDLRPTTRTSEKAKELGLIPAEEGRIGKPLKPKKKVEEKKK